MRGRARAWAVLFVIFPPRVDDQAYSSQDEDLPPPGRQPLGPAEEPAGAPRLRAGRAWPKAPQAVGLRPAARREAEAQAVLRQHDRAPIPPRLRDGLASAWGYGRE